MKFSAGYQADTAWIDVLIARREVLCDVYFAFGAMPSGRMAVADEERQLEDLGRLADAGIALHLLMAASFFCAVFFQLVWPRASVTPLHFWHRLLLTIAVTTAAWLAATFATKPEKGELDGVLWNMPGSVANTS